jgi:hypothetical protein
MALIDVQRAVLSVCFEAQAPEAALAALGDRKVWLLYRELTRDRLWREIEFALPRTCAALERATLQRTFVQHLDRDPPRTRFFQGIVRSFADSALRSWQNEPGIPEHVHDLLRYELALWEVSDLEATLPPELIEFAFDRVPVVSSALSLLQVQHAVHLPHCTKGEFWLCIQRGSNEARPQTWKFNRTTFALLEDFQRGDATASDSVQRVARRLGAKVTPQYIERLCETLAQWIEVGILLGSR